METFSFWSSFVLPFGPPGVFPRERTERKGRERKGKELGIQKYYGRGRFLVSKFGDLFAPSRGETEEREEERRTRGGTGRSGTAEERGEGVAETVKWNELAARRNSDIRSLFPYFNYLVIPAIYIMYFGHRIGASTPQARVSNRLNSPVDT